MENRINPTQNPLTLQELGERRKNTELVAQWLQQELISILDTLRPLLVPERALANYPGAKLEFEAVEKSYGRFLQSYKELTGRPFDLARDFDSDYVTNISSRLELYRWEYLHEIPTARGAKTITMTSPLRWILTYPSSYHFSQMREAMAGRNERRTEYMRQFVINSLVMQLAISKAPGLPRLFEALRYGLTCEQPTEWNKLPLVIITSTIPSFRPPDELIAEATEFSGVPAFIELIDTDAIARAEDPLKVKIREILAASDDEPDAGTELR